jgi:hypothetical protein
MRKYNRNAETSRIAAALVEDGPSQFDLDIELDRRYEQEYGGEYDDYDPWDDFDWDGYYEYQGVDISIGWHEEVRAERDEDALWDWPDLHPV